MPRALSRFRKIIAAKDLSTTNAAALLNVSQSYLSEVLLGQKRPGLAIAIKIEKKFDVPVQDWCSPAEIEVK